MTKKCPEFAAALIHDSDQSGLQLNFSHLRFGGNVIMAGCSELYINGALYLLKEEDGGLLHCVCD